MPVPSVAIGTGAKVSGPLRLYHEFRGDVVSAARLGAGAAVGAAGSRNIVHSPGYGFQPPLTLEQHVKGTQTILAPVLTTVGLDIAQDQTAADGAEYTLGINARNPFAFVVGTDLGFFFEIRAKVEDASGFNPFLVGFRKAEAYQADWNDYDELAAIGIQGTANPNTIKLGTILNNAATVVTDTTDTWADAATKTLRVMVSAARAVTYSIDGSAPTAVAAYSFDAGEVVVPFLLFLHAADVGGTLELIHLDVGYQ